VFWPGLQSLIQLCLHQLLVGASTAESAVLTSLLAELTAEADVTPGTFALLIQEGQGRCVYAQQCVNADLLLRYDTDICDGIYIYCTVV
jgi:hypothetical protein